MSTKDKHNVEIVSDNETEKLPIETPRGHGATVDGELPGALNTNGTKEGE